MQTELNQCAGGSSSLWKQQKSSTEPCQLMHHTQVQIWGKYHGMCSTTSRERNHLLPNEQTEEPDRPIRASPGKHEAAQHQTSHSSYARNTAKSSCEGRSNHCTLSQEQDCWGCHVPRPRRGISLLRAIITLPVNWNCTAWWKRNCPVLLSWRNQTSTLSKAHNVD